MKACLSTLLVVLALGACGDSSSSRRDADAAETDPGAWNDASDALDGAVVDAAPDSEHADADTDADADAVPAVRARMDFAGADFYDHPWPCESRRGPDGRPSMVGFPNPERLPFVTSLVELVQGTSGFGTTSPVFVAFEGALDPASLPGMNESIAAGASVFLSSVVAPGEPTERVPIELRFLSEAGPHGAENLLVALPYQGIALRPEQEYALVVTRAVLDDRGRALGVPESLRELRAGRPVPGLSGPARQAYERALVGVGDQVDTSEIAALVVFRTQDPTRGFRDAWTSLDTELRLVEAPSLSEVYDDFCVFAARVDVPIYQAGTPPFDGVGGAWVTDASGALVQQGTEEANVWITVPRSVMPERGYPVSVFVRTGGGGDRPLIDRGVRAAPGGPTEPGSGMARHLARIGFAGISVDGPHGGRRNVSGRDEQLLIFNFQNPVAMRDNIRQSALELALIPALLDRLRLDVAECPDADAGAAEGANARFDGQHIALIGHSMGATIAPLVVAIQPRFGALILSGAGGSWIENVVHKRSPIPVRPLAELILRYDPGALHTHDPALALLQWVGESADPPVYALGLVARRFAEGAPLHVLMFQGIVDTYILPPIANALTLSAGLDLAGPARDEAEPRLAAFDSLAGLLGLVASSHIGLPASGNRADGRVTAVVVQHEQDPVEDGHEVMFQLEAPKRQVSGFLSSWLRGVPSVPSVPE